jgi:hypothetical protein
MFAFKRNRLHSRILPAFNQTASLGCEELEGRLVQTIYRWNE